MDLYVKDAEVTEISLIAGLPTSTEATRWGHERLGHQVTRKVVES